LSVSVTFSNGVNKIGIALFSFINSMPSRIISILEFVNFGPRTVARLSEIISS
jgi:hypothetical protein